MECGGERGSMCWVVEAVMSTVHHFSQFFLFLLPCAISDAVGRPLNEPTSLPQVNPREGVKNKRS